jgi:septum formation protein
MPRIILASTSRYRCELLARLGLLFEAIAPPIDEEAWKDAALSPAQLALHLARAKAKSVAELHPEALVIGSDQTCACEGELLHKPGSFAAACEQLAFLSGKTHELHTAVSFVHGLWSHEHVDTTRLHMRRLAPDEIERYVGADQPLDCVGSYKLEQRGISLFDRIESADHTAIVGMPLLSVAGVLRERGCQVP